MSKNRKNRSSAGPSRTRTNDANAQLSEEQKRKRKISRQAAARASDGRKGLLTDKKFQKAHRGGSSPDKDERNAICKSLDLANDILPTLTSIRTGLQLFPLPQEALKAADALFGLCEPPIKFPLRDTRAEEPAKEFIKTLEGIASAPPGIEDRDISGHNLARLALDQYQFGIEFKDKDAMASHHALLRLLSVMLRLAKIASQQKKEQEEPNPESTEVLTKFEEMLVILYEVHQPLVPGP
ncbi:unnamed protein product [Tilletia laevis]|uniref:Uncharacterized protein n=3 Tax=Tilletia TaxID=13289 RepID=A0A8X7MJ58_9BASI|nr:hypothetical protein CF336_g9421 [Tilletia laevis]KAE8180584.1 hypothetical protein CF328_g9114 [Tilletia controversa]KAE8236740.1 hypothetical protein A4X03_0g9342 [Tilletia caries]KAE8180415.1 hypothetical protein CF335_g9258 [Tilletia laevis]KAE8236823.1 hypothetical protein A4X06_0g9427 [Tilletia controversa]